MFGEEVASGWMMAGLLEVELSSVNASALVGLAKDGVEWLEPVLVLKEPTDVLGHCELHTFYWVRGLSSPL